MKKFVLLLFAGGLLLFAGCIHESVVGGTKVFTFELSVLILGILVCLGFGIGGWFSRKTNSWTGWMLMIICTLALVLAAPGFFLDKVTVNSQELTVDVGFWFNRNQHQVTFDDVRMIGITKKETSGPRGRKRASYTMACLMKSGETKNVPIGTLVEKALPEILRQADQRDIVVQDLTWEKQE